MKLKKKGDKHIFLSSSGVLLELLDEETKLISRAWYVSCLGVGVVAGTGEHKGSLKRIIMLEWFSW